jgi:hypothetical protein
MTKTLLSLVAAAVFSVATLHPAIAGDSNELVPVPLLQDEINPPVKAAKKSRKAVKPKAQVQAQADTQSKSKIRVRVRKQRR